MSGEGDVTRARADFIAAGSKNLRALLRHRLGWMNDFIRPDRSALSHMETLLVRPSARDVVALNSIPYVHAIDSTVNFPPVNPIPFYRLLGNVAQAIDRIRASPWQSGSLRAALPWPIPNIDFPEFSDRVERLRRLFHFT
jgi:hypothetical protein